MRLALSCWYRIRGIDAGIALPVLVVMLVGGLGLLFGWSHDRALKIEASTSIVSLKVHTQFQMMLPEGRMLPSLDSKGNVYLGAAETLAGGPMSVGAETLVVFELAPDTGKLTITLDSGPALPLPTVGGRPLTYGTKLFVERNDRYQMGAIVAVAAVTIGRKPSTGSLRLLESADFSFAERLSFPQRVTVTQTGDVLAGDVITVEDEKDGGEYAVRIFIDPAPIHDPTVRRDTLFVVVDAPFGRPVLVADRIGLAPDDRFRLVPSWSDRALKDPLFLGISSLLALTLVVVEMLKLLLFRKS